jgi:hypothetical protein
MFQLTPISMANSPKIVECLEKSICFDNGSPLGREDDPTETLILEI